jgi:hypothetical protein
MGSLQTWSSNAMGSAAVLKQEKRPRLKSPNTEVKPVPLANILIRFPTTGREAVLSCQEVGWGSHSNDSKKIGLLHLFLFAVSSVSDPDSLIPDPDLAV